MTDDDGVVVDDSERMWMEWMGYVDGTSPGSFWT